MSFNCSSCSLEMTPPFVRYQLNASVLLVNLWCRAPVNPDVWCLACPSPSLCRVNATYWQDLPSCIDPRTFPLDYSIEFGFGFGHLRKASLNDSANCESGTSHPCSLDVLIVGNASSGNVFNFPELGFTAQPQRLSRNPLDF